MARKKQVETEEPKKSAILPEFLYVEEVQQIVSNADSSTIVNADDYIYFCIAPSYEAVQFRDLYQDDWIRVLMVLNFKDNPIGYLIYFEKYPAHRKMSDFGAGFFFSKIRRQFKSYKKCDIAFADQKFRILRYDEKDYFASVKWKSTNPLEATE